MLQSVAKCAPLTFDYVAKVRNSEKVGNKE